MPRHRRRASVTEGPDRSPGPRVRLDPPATATWRGRDRRRARRVHGDAMAGGDRRSALSPFSVFAASAEDLRAAS